MRSSCKSFPAKGCCAVSPGLSQGSATSRSPTNGPTRTHTPCVPQPLYDFGLDSDSRTFVCATTGAWLPAGSLVGLREVALPCDAINESAQDPNGIPLFCAQINGSLRWANRADTPGPPRCISAAFGCLFGRA